MSVLFLPPSAGAASVPDATETVSGKIRIATSAEATAGTNDVTAMTPAKTKSVVDAAVVGGVTYQGTFDASSPADLSNATKGDLYIISVAGTYQGQTWAVGDHLLINADMGGTLDPAKIDKVDNTDSVTSVAGRTGAVTLSTADISGLATVASTGAYSDLSGTPTLGTAAAEDVGTAAGNVVQLNGSAQLPAVDGSLLTGLPSDVSSISSNFSLTVPTPSSPEFVVVRLQAVGTGQTVTLPTAGAGVNGTTVLVANDNANYAITVQPSSGSIYLRNNSSASVTLEPNQVATFTAILGLWFVTDINYLNLDVSAPVNGEALVYNGATGLWENSTVSASVAALNDIGDVSAAAPSNTNVLKYNSTSGDWEDGAVAYSEVTGTPTLATVATTGAYSDLSGTPTNVSTFTNDAGYLTAITGESVGDLSDVTLTTPSAGQALVYNGTLSVFENATITATVSALNDIGDVSAASPNNGDVIAYNSTSGDWEATAQSGGSAPSVTVSSPSADQTLSAPSGIEEVYIYTPSAAINVNLVAAATCGSGFKYQIKNRSTNTLTIDPNGSETIDGSATFAIASQEASVTLITDGSNWFII